MQVPGAAPQGQQQPPAMRSDAHIILSGVQASETNHAAIHAIVTAPQPTGPPADLLKPDIHGGSILISIPKPEQYSEVPSTNPSIVARMNFRLGAACEL